jgi:hypothetical protein
LSTENDAEPVLTQQVAGRLMGGIGVMGGTLMLTDRRLVFVPLISKAGLKLSNKAAKASQKLHDWDFSPQRLLNTAIMPLTTPIDMPLNRIRTITPTRRCALLVSWVDTGKPRKAEFAVSASRFSPIWNRENVASHDRFLAAVVAALPDRPEH